MKYTKELRKAIFVANKWHKGQKERGGGDYVWHLVRVADMASRTTAKGVDKQTAAVVGLLHDTLEDTKYSVAQLQHDFPHEVSKAVMDLTECKPGTPENYHRYIDRLMRSGNRLAWAVKECDLKDHLDKCRAATMKPEKKPVYEWALQRIQDALY